MLFLSFFFYGFTFFFFKRDWKGRGKAGCGRGESGAGGGCLTIDLQVSVAHLRLQLSVESLQDVGARVPGQDALDVQATVGAHGLPPRVRGAGDLVARAYDVAGHQVIQAESGPRVPVVGKQLPQKPVDSQCDVVPLGWLGRLGGDRDLGPHTQESG